MCREIRSEYKVLRQKQIEQNKKEAKMYGNMFSRLSKLEASEKVRIQLNESLRTCIVAIELAMVENEVNVI